MAVRATTTNVHGQKQRAIPPPPKKSKELDPNYLQALKLIQQSCRQQEKLLAIEDNHPRKSDVLQPKHSKSCFQFSSTLTPIGQEAMIKTYEDTLISHVNNAYPVKGIGIALPRLRTAAYRHRQPVKGAYNTTRLENIQRAQNLIDSILTDGYKKDDMIFDYIRWQRKWTKDFS